MFFRLAISGGVFAIMFILFFGIIITQNLDLGSSFTSFLGGGLAMGATLLITKNIKNEDLDIYMYGEQPKVIDDLEKLEREKREIPISKQLIKAMEDPPKPPKEHKKEDLSELEIEFLSEKHKSLSEIEQKIKELDLIAEEYAKDLNKTKPSLLAQKEKEYEEKLEKIEKLKAQKENMKKEVDNEDKPKYTIHKTKI